MTTTNDLPNHELAERIGQLLKRLKLSQMAARLDDEQRRAVSDDNEPLRLLYRLLEHEWRVRTERRIERRIRESKLPERKLLSDFDFDFQPGLNRPLVMQLATLRFVDKGQGILFGGNSGTGKSFLAKAIALLACHQSYRVRYTTASAMLTDLHSGLADDSVQDKLKAYVAPALLVIDELGFDRLEQEGSRNATLFFKVIDTRYRRVVSTIITTNIDFKMLGEYLGDPLATASIADRMLHHSVVINIDGPSWRLQQSEQLNRSEREQLDGPAVAASKTPSKVKSTGRKTVSTPSKAGAKRMRKPRR
jgi:DNA replication protein DnaC